jgi:hypothetical protein
LLAGIFGKRQPPIRKRVLALMETSGCAMPIRELVHLILTPGETQTLTLGGTAFTFASYGTRPIVCALYRDAKGEVNSFTGYLREHNPYLH